MFIKKDLRKIPRILSDAAPVDDEDDGLMDKNDERAPKRTKRDVLTELRLSRRNSEFNGSLKILCQPEYAPSLQHLVNLSLYDCQIKSLNGIGMLASPVDGRDMCCPNLAELNVGRNPLTTLPDELSMLSDLRELWCDDCQLTGHMPECVWKLTELETLRVSNNKLTHIAPEISNLTELTTLCLDGNEIEELPCELVQLRHLKSLMLRNNKLAALPDLSGMDLTLLHVSSNQLESLSLCPSLVYLYANSNRLATVDGLDKLEMLERATLSHNNIQSLPLAFVERFGEAADVCDKDPTCVVALACNPVLKQGSSPEKSKDDMQTD